MYDYYELEIVETGRDSLKADPESDYFFNQIRETMKTEEEAANYLMERYGKQLNFEKLRPIYQDDKDGKTHQVGYLYSYWNKDISHNSKSWYQTDWITVVKVTRNDTPVLFKRSAARV